MKKVKLNILVKANLLLSGIIVFLGFGCHREDTPTLVMYGIPPDTIDTMVVALYGINYAPFEVKDTIQNDIEQQGTDKNIQN